MARLVVPSTAAPVVALQIWEGASLRVVVYDKPEPCQQTVPCSVVKAFSNTTLGLYQVGRGVAWRDRPGSPIQLELQLFNGSHYTGAAIPADGALRLVTG